MYPNAGRVHKEMEFMQYQSIYSSGLTAISRYCLTTIKKTRYPKKPTAGKSFEKKTPPPTKQAKNGIWRKQANYWNEMIGVLGHESALQGYRPYWAGDKLGWDEFCDETCPWCGIDRSTCWPAVQRASTEVRTPPTNQLIHMLGLHLLRPIFAKILRWFPPRR